MLYLKNKIKNKIRKYLRRKNKTNAQVKSTHPEYRVIINKSNKYITAQVIALDGKVVASMSDKKSEGKNKSEKAKAAGVELAGMLKKAKVKKVVFDRNGHLYHGRVKAFAEGIREGGINL